MAAPCSVVLLVGLLLPALAAAQAHVHATAPASETWAWDGDAAVFLNLNVQERKYTDFHHVESQNWLMGHGRRAVGRTTLTLHGMASLEPFTLRRLGSAQTFQTGETLDGAPLIDYQHPHDLFMALEFQVDAPAGGSARAFIRAAPVGEATFGPVAFMHRPSAAGNPTAPLAHHFLDSTHITRSVIAGGVRIGAHTIEGATFKGQEPDEDRLDLDLGVPDSVSVRWSWRAPRWGLQVSAARRHEPETVDPVDETSMTASIGGTATWLERPVTWLFAYGRNAHAFEATAAWLLEGNWRPSPLSLTYLRGEVADKNILTAGGLHPPGFRHEHIISTVAALTLGYERSVATTRVGRFAVGGDITFHVVPPELSESYGRPWSVHVGLRYRTPE